MPAEAATPRKLDAAAWAAFTARVNTATRARSAVELGGKLDAIRRRVSLDGDGGPDPYQTAAE